MEKIRCCGNRGGGGGGWKFGTFGCDIVHNGNKIRLINNIVDIIAGNLSLGGGKRFGLCVELVNLSKTTIISLPFGVFRIKLCLMGWDIGCYVNCYMG